MFLIKWNIVDSDGVVDADTHADTSVEVYEEVDNDIDADVESDTSTDADVSVHTEVDEADVVDSDENNYDQCYAYGHTHAWS